MDARQTALFTDAKTRDRADPLARFRQEFAFPQTPEGKPYVYLTGNSLGLQPKKALTYVMQEMEDWARLGVEGHFHARKPWYPYHEFLTEPVARLVGALPTEVVVMNGTTVNLHLMLTSFYRPTKERNRILVLKTAFPSDRYAVDSHVKLHGYKPEEAVLELTPRDGEETIRIEDVMLLLQDEGKRLALVLLESPNYLTGQAFPMKEITAEAHRQGALVGWDLAHGAGNLVVKLHDWDVDFAVWCSYKYLNGGPGAVAGAFIHERHTKDDSIPRLSGWWGFDKAKRFEMSPKFLPIQSAEAWQLSNPPILQMAALRASLEIFDAATIELLRQKSEKLTGYFAEQLATLPADRCQIITPADSKSRGAQLSLRLKGSDFSWVKWFHDKGIICDFRRPDIFRASPVPLYCGYEDVARFCEALREKIGGGK